MLNLNERSEQYRGELEQELIMLRYAHIMAFETQTGEDSAFLTWIAYREDPEAQRFTEIVFVHSEEDAARFDVDVLVAWPGWGTWRALDGFNYMLFWATEARHIPEHLSHIKIPESLSYPLTFEAIVDNWEEVNELLSSFPCGWQTFPFRYAWTIGFLEEYRFSSEMIRALHDLRGPAYLEDRAAWEQERVERREQYEEWWAQEQSNRENSD